MKRKYIGWAVIIAALVIILIVIGYQIDATGFNGYHTVTIATSHSGTSPATVTRTVVEVPAKSFWDWLQLLIVPAILTLGAIWFTGRQSHDLKIAQQQREHDEMMAVENQRETALQTYIDKMSDLLLDKNLRTSHEDDDVRKIATARTLTVLPNLDSQRKRSVVKFLLESGLINWDVKIIDFAETDLSEANLSEMNFDSVDLSYVDLREANLFKTLIYSTTLSNANLGKASLSEALLIHVNLEDACLIEVDLSRAKLENTNLKNANLFQANLSGAWLKNVDLSGVDLSRAKLNDTLLRDANLSNAKLSYTDLGGADLTGADLTGANLKGSDITQDQLDSAKSIKDIKR